MDPDELGELEAKLGMDYELGEEFKDKVESPAPCAPAHRAHA
jgi:hypothetical protein